MLLDRQGLKVLRVNKGFKGLLVLLAPLDQQVRRDQLAPQDLRVRKGLQELQASPVRLEHRDQQDLQDHKVLRVNKDRKDRLV